MYCLYDLYLDWDIHYAALVEYGEEYGHCNVPTRKNTPIDEYYKCVLKGLGTNGSNYKYFEKLGRWLDDQRRKKRGTRGNAVLTTEQDSKLQTLVNKGT